VDGFSSHRDKGTVAGLMVAKGSRVSYLPFACETSSGSAANDISQFIKTKLTYMACITAKSTSPDDMMASLKAIAEKIRFWVTDDGK